MKNSKEKLAKKNKGITLVALVVTVIVLLILVGVTINLVLNDEGIFKNAKSAGEKTKVEKAREMLEIVLMDAQIMKHSSEGLTDEQLTNKIKTVGEEREGGTQVVVEGYIFEIDRSVPKIVDYIGLDNGVIIKCKITGNENWIKGETANIQVAVTIEDNSGPLDTGSIIVRKDGEDITSSVNVTSGIFTLMTDKNTTYVIDVKSSKGKRVSKTIDVNAKLDFTPPTVEKVITTVESMKLKLSATGYDKNSEGEEESGIDYFSYAISPTEGISRDRATGKIKIGESVEIETTKAIEYTITVTGTDNVGNVTAEENAKTEKAETRFNNRRS